MKIMYAKYLQTKVRIVLFNFQKLLVLSKNVEIFSIITEMEGIFQFTELIATTRYDNTYDLVLYC